MSHESFLLCLQMTYHLQSSKQIRKWPQMEGQMECEGTRIPLLEPKGEREEGTGG